MDIERIDALMDDADNKIVSGAYDEALKLCREAISLIPEPLIDEPKATEVIAAIGDIYFLQGDFESAQQAYTDVMLCPGAPASEYVRLRRGQIAFELGDMNKAKVELACAFMNGGEEIFEDEDPKYFNFIEPIMHDTE